MQTQALRHSSSHSRQSVKWHGDSAEGRGQTTAPFSAPTALLAVPAAGLSCGVPHRWHGLPCSFLPVVAIWLLLGMSQGTTRAFKQPLLHEVICYPADGQWDAAATHTRVFRCMPRGQKPLLGTAKPTAIRVNPHAGEILTRAAKPGWNQEVRAREEISQKQLCHVDNSLSERLFTLSKALR